MERITIRIPEGLSKLLDQLAHRANTTASKKHNLGIINPQTRSQIAREALARGLFDLGKNNLKRTTSANV